MSRLTKAVRKMLGVKRRHTGTSLEQKGRMPDFFICGAARSGTTSLWQYLRQHPDIYMPPAIEHKEPSYFCDLYGMKDWQAYLSLFRDAGNKKRLGEASGPYLTSPESAGRIKAAAPDAGIIISLRNPVERAWSLYKWMHTNGYEKLPSFAEALATEESRLENADFIRNNGQYYYNFLYFHSGLYHDQVKRFFDTFGRDRVRVIIFEEFTEAPSEHIKAAYKFLEVDPAFSPALEVHNASDRAYGDLEKGLRIRLSERYLGSIAQLEELLGRNLRRLWV